jgi:hypothetical protein
MLPISMHLPLTPLLTAQRLVQLAQLWRTARLLTLPKLGPLAPHISTWEQQEFNIGLFQKPVFTL